MSKGPRFIHPYDADEIRFNYPDVQVDTAWVRMAAYQAKQMRPYVEPDTQAGLDAVIAWAEQAGDIGPDSFAARLGERFQQVCGDKDSPDVVNGLFWPGDDESSPGESERHRIHTAVKSGLPIEKWGISATTPQELYEKLRSVQSRLENVERLLAPILDLGRESLAGFGAQVGDGAPTKKLEFTAAADLTAALGVFPERFGRGYLEDPLATDQTNAHEDVRDFRIKAIFVQEMARHFTKYRPDSAEALATRDVAVAVADQFPGDPELEGRYPGRLDSRENLRAMVAQLATDEVANMLEAFARTTNKWIDGQPGTDWRAAMHNIRDATTRAYSPLRRQVSQPVPRPGPVSPPLSPR